MTRLAAALLLLFLAVSLSVIRYLDRALRLPKTPREADWRSLERVDSV